MSRTFHVDTEKDKELTLKSFMDELHRLQFFDTTDWKISHDGHAVDPDSIGTVFINKGLTCFAIHGDYTDCIFISRHHSKEGIWWCIESRALEGIGRSFFVAAACVIANLTDGLANSCDGAWHNDHQYRGSELWNEYLNTEWNSH